MSTQESGTNRYTTHKEPDFELQMILGKPTWVLVIEPEPEPEPEPKPKFAPTYTDVEVIDITPTYSPFFMQVGRFTKVWTIPGLVFGYLLSWMPFFMSALSSWIVDVTTTGIACLRAFGGFMLYVGLPVMLCIFAAAHILLFFVRRLSATKESPAETPTETPPGSYVVNSGGTVINVHNHTQNNTQNQSHD
jgi:hypothetical protein